MAWTKAKTAIAVGIGLLVTAGTTTVAVKMSAVSAARNRQHIFSNGLNGAHTIPGAIYTYPAGDELTHQYVTGIVKLFRKDLDAAQAVKSDRELTDADIQGHTIYVYGSPENHTLFERVRDQLPIVFEKDGVIVGNKKCLGRDVGAIFTCPNPLSPANRLVIYGTVSPEALTEMNSIFHGPTDYIIFNNTTRQAPGVKDNERYLLLGSFDKSKPASWRVDKRLEVLAPKELQAAAAKVVVKN